MAQSAMAAAPAAAPGKRQGMDIDPVSSRIDMQVVGKDVAHGRVRSVLGLFDPGITMPVRSRRNAGLSLSASHRAAYRAQP